MQGLLSKDKHELMFRQFGLNYNHEPEQFKKGSILVRHMVRRAGRCQSRSRRR